MVCVLAVQIIAGGNELQKILRQINMEGGKWYHHYLLTTKSHAFCIGDFLITIKGGVKELLVSL